MIYEDKDEEMSWAEFDERLTAAMRRIGVPSRDPGLRFDRTMQRKNKGLIEFLDSLSEFHSRRTAR